MDDIKRIVSSVIDDLSNKKGGGPQDIQKSWDETLNKKEKEHARIYQIQNQTLVVHVDSSAWLFHFHLRKGKILKALQEKNIKLQKLYFRTGPLK